MKIKNKLFISIFIALCVCFSTFSKVQSETRKYNNYRVYSAGDLSALNSNSEKEKPSNILFIVDFSNSMNDTISGRPKIDIARSTLGEIVPAIPPNVKTGLRVYGHKGGFTYLQGCMASNLTVPLGTNNAQNIMASLYGTKATGWTPITYSLKQAVNKDLAGIQGKKHIILISDGGENCDESPCTYVINLLKERNDIVIDVIAFDIQDVEANNQLRCTALVTSGKFLTANSESALSKSLFETTGVNKDVKGTVQIPQEGKNKK